MAIKIPRFLRHLRDVVISAPADGEVLTYDGADGRWKNEVSVGGGGGGAPTTADYLVGTTQGGLSAEIIVGTTPGGELGGTWAAPTVDTVHSGSSHGATRAAAEATAAAALADHVTDASDAHDASAISSVAAGGLAATDVQSALNELDTEKTTLTTFNDHSARHENGGADEISVAGLSGLLADGQTPAAHATSHQDGGSDELSITGLSGTPAALQTHLDDTADAHNASAISFVPAGTISSTDVQGAIEEVAAEATGGGGGAPTDAEYLVGAASGGLSAEIVVGATPGGELGGTWAAPTVDATHSGSSHASVQAAAEATAAAALTAHTGDASDAHDASAISSIPAGGLAATEVQAALNELDSEKVSATTFNDHSARHENGGADEISIAGLDGTSVELAAHLADTTDAHDASAVSFTPTGSIAATDVQSAIAEVATDLVTGAVGGAISIPYTFDTSTVDGDPGAGKLRLNSATQNLASQIFVDLLDSLGTDWTDALDVLDDADNTGDKGQIRLFNPNDLSKWIVSTVALVQTASGYRKISAAIVDSSGANPFANGDPVVLTFTRTGDQGQFAPFSAVWAFDSSTVAGDPGVGEFRLNADLGVDPLNVTAIYINDEDAVTGGTWSFIFTDLDAVDNPTKGLVSITRRDLPATEGHMVWRITDLTNNTGWWTITVAPAQQTASPPLSPGNRATIGFAFAGDRGDTATGGATLAVTQAAHGLSVGNIVRLSGTSYIKAQANSAANAEAVGIVSAVADANNFTVQSSGRITGLSGLTAGAVYYLDDDTAGLLTTTEPSDVGDVSKPLLIAATTTSGWIENMRGFIVPAVGSDGAPDDATYLVTTAHADLSAEVVVGATPGGELGGTWASPTVDATHSGSSHASVQAAAEATAAAALAAHTGDTSDAHDASAISILDSANDFTATEVEGALAELQAADEADEAALAAHLADTGDAHDASAISFVPTGTIAGTDVQTALAEVATEATAVYRSTDLAFYVDYVGGLDANNGLSPTLAKKTVQAAYDALPATGGTIIMLPGTHVGLLAGDSTKTAVITSLSGKRVRRANSSSNFAVGDVRWQPTLNDDRIVDITNAVTIGNGWEFHGIVFDMSDTDTVYGIHSNNVNHGVVTDCAFIGNESPVGEPYGIRIDADGGMDCSWWRLDRNYARKVGLVFGNADQHSITENIIFPGLSHGIRLDSCTRCATFHNEISSVDNAMWAIHLTNVDFSTFMADSGEGVQNFIRSTGGSSSNYYQPAGNVSPVSTDVLISDDNPTFNIAVTTLARQVDYAEARPVPATVTAVTQYDILFDDKLVLMDSTSNNTNVRLPAPASAYNQRHTIRRLDATANTATINTVSGNIDGVASATLAIAGNPGDTKTFMSDGTNWRRISPGDAAIGGPPTGAAAGALDGTYPNPGLAASVAGNGLAETSNVLSVNVDDSTVEISSDALRVKDLGISTAKIAAGAVTAAKVAADVATQAELDAHVNDTADAHDASAISFSPTGTIAATDVQAAIAEVASEAAGGGSGTDLSDAIAQTAHGLAVGNIVRYNGTAYVKAQANSVANAEVVGVVSAVADANNFTLIFAGLVEGLSGLTAGTVYYLDDDTSGLLTATEPTDVDDISKPVLISISTTSGLFFNMRGFVVSDTAAAGAPDDATYLVTTAHAGLSAEVAVGATPGGELGGTWAAPTVDATHSGSTHAAVQAAAEATAAAALAAHTGDTTDAHDASAISILDAASDFTATEVEGALAELQAADEVDEAALAAHLVDTSAAHAASAVSVSSTTLSGTGTDAQAVFEELDNLLDDHSARHENGGADEISIAGLDGTPVELTNHLNDTADAHDASAISFTPAGSIAATDVQAAIVEAASEAVGPYGGAVAIPYLYNNVTTETDPGNGFLAFNFGSPDSVTAIRCDLLDDNGDSVTDLLDSLDNFTTGPIKGLVRVSGTDNPEWWAVWSLTSVGGETGYRNLNVTYIDHSSGFSLNTPVTLTFTPAGSAAAVATDSLWDATGDLAVGSGANTSARLARGTPGQILIPTATSLAWAGNPLFVTAPTGGLFENIPRYVAMSGSAPTSGTMRMMAIWLPEGLTVTSIGCIAGGTAEAGGTHCWAALYDGSRNLLRQSTNETGAAAITANAIHTFTLTSTFVTTYSGLYYIGVSVVATTMPTLLTMTTGNVTAMGVAPIISGTSTTGLTGTAPNPAAAITVAQTVTYCFVS